MDPQKSVDCKLLDQASVHQQKTNESPLVPPSLTYKVAQYRVYPERWVILVAVFLLNVANYAHWVAYPSVNKVAAEYYDQAGDVMDWIPTLSYGLGVPCGILATYVVERYGLKHGIQIGGSLTGIGGLMCFLSSLPHLDKDMSADFRFYLALIGQALTGVACPFVASVPTKISQHWFADEQRTIATTLLGMAGSVGCILGQGVTPLLVYDDPGRIWIMNTVWFVPAAVGSLLTMWKVHRNYPPLPPSPSAAVIPKAKSVREWLTSIKTIFTNKAFIIIFIFLGACMGCVSSVMTKIEQIMCSRGYSDQLSGLAGAMILTSAAVASLPINLLAYKSGRSSLVCKLFIAVGLFGVIGNAYFMRLPDHGAYIVVSCVLMGGFAVGAYAVALELVVECTYPVDQATSTAFIFLSSALQGVILMFMENTLSSPLFGEEAMEIQTCKPHGTAGHESDGLHHQEPRDHSSYLNFLAIYIWVTFALFAFFFKTEMKRTNADKLLNLEHAEAISSSSRHSSEGLSTEVSSASSSRSRSSSSSIIKDKHSPIIKVRMGDIEEGNNVQLLSASPKTST